MGPIEYVGHLLALRHGGAQSPAVGPAGNPSLLSEQNSRALVERLGDESAGSLSDLGADGDSRGRVDRLQGALVVLGEGGVELGEHVGVAGRIQKAQLLTGAMVGWADLCKGIIN